MTLEQLRIFVYVAERSHMTRAAEALGLTQSAVSAAINALETRHDVRLFDRVGRGLVLTEAGRVFLSEATAVLLQARTAEQALMDLAGLRRGQLTVAASQTVSGYWLPGRLARFAEAFPGLHIEVIAGNTQDAARAVADGRAEIGLIEGEIDDWELLRRLVARDRISLFSAPDHPLASGAPSAEALAQARWALRETGSGTRAHVERELSARGLPATRLRIVLELPSNEAALNAAAEGGLVTAVSDLAAAPFERSGRVVRLNFDLAPRAFELLTHRKRRLSAAGQAFVETIAEID